jgi:hypothetical protein
MNGTMKEINKVQTVLDRLPSVDDMAKYAEVLEEEEGRGGEGRSGEERG